MRCVGTAGEKTEEDEDERKTVYTKLSEELSTALHQAYFVGIHVPSHLLTS
jgi:hypothetical protein